MAKRRKIMIDGTGYESVAVGAEKIGVTSCALAKAIETHDPAFSYHGHNIIASPKVHIRASAEYGYIDSERAPRPLGPDPLEVAIKARKMYDERGVSRMGLLARRPA